MVNVKLFLLIAGKKTVQAQWFVLNKNINYFCAFFPNQQSVFQLPLG